MKQIHAVFYKSSSGSEPVRSWLMDLSQEDRKIIGADIKSVEFGWPMGMPTVRKLNKKIREVRSDISDGRIARVLFAIEGNKMILLHGIVKKTQKTPPQDIDLALKRLKSSRS